jgi:gliding motility-associated-like protein
VSGAGTITDPTSDTTTVTGLTNGTSEFMFTVTNSTCTYDSTITLTVTPITANAGADFSNCDSVDVMLHADSTENGTWLSPNGKITFNDATAPNAEASGLAIGANILVWTVTAGTCSESDTVIYTRKTVAECVEDSLAMPTGISPNNDGKNDYFVIHGIERYTTNKLTIYNRWGDEVFEQDDYTNNPSTMWQGQDKNGKQLPDGTYFALLSATPNAGGSVRKLKGYVDLRSNNLNSH